MQDLTQPVSRPAQILAGITLGLLCALFCLFGVATLAAIVARELVLPRGGVFLFSSFAIFGFLGLLTSARLVLGRRRARDGGLFSPGALRLAALLAIVSTPVIAWQHPIHLLELSLTFAFVAGLFALARRRERALTG